jgi:hypothetical protein
MLLAITGRKSCGSSMYAVPGAPHARFGAIHHAGWQQLAGETRAPDHSNGSDDGGPEEQERGEGDRRR